MASVQEEDTVLKMAVNIFRGNFFVWWHRYHEPSEVNNIPLILPRQKQAVEKEIMTSSRSQSWDPGLILRSLMSEALHAGINFISS